jgi:ArsR family transcriptional regulator
MMKIVRDLKALANEKRFKIVQMLLKQDYCVMALSSELQISEAAVSQHVTVLKKQGFLVPIKSGKYVHYVVNEKKLKEMTIFLGLMSNKDDRNKCDKVSETTHRACHQLTHFNAFLKKRNLAS